MSEVETTILERLAAHSWNVELIAIGMISAYFVAFKLGSYQNSNMVNKIVDSWKPTLEENFFQVGVTPKNLLAQDDTQNYTLYASGRLRLESFLAKFQLKSRQNIFMLIVETIMSFFVEFIPLPQDLLSIEIKFDQETCEKFDDFIWAVVTKDNMNKYREDSYCLSLTKTTESPKLPNEFVFMGEVAEMNEILYTKKLNELIQLNKSTLKYICVTDQSIEKPAKISELKSQKRLLLQFKPTSNAKDIENLGSLVNYIVNDYADMIVQKGTFRAELLRKIKKTRENEYAKLKKAIDDLKRDELNQQKLEEQKRIKANMTPEQQEKLAQKQKEKKQRKMMNKQKVRS